ncbi:hypothetical protein BDV12DRAFT_170924 [Aspergillus spectabilis]
MKKEGEPDIVDHSEPGWVDWLTDAFSDINDALSTKEDALDVTTTNMEPTSLNGVQNFIFPGGKVFTYKSHKFSDSQDLTCAITYVDPSVGRNRDNKLLLTTAMDSQPDLALTHSSNLMLNYFQGELVSPTSRFEALQTADGHSMLFALDSGCSFHVIQEQSGTSRTGWQLYDLSTSIIHVYFPDTTDATVRTFR